MQVTSFYAKSETILIIIILILEILNLLEKEITLWNETGKILSDKIKTASAVIPNFPFLLEVEKSVHKQLDVT